MLPFVTDESCSRLYCSWKAIIFFCSICVGDIGWFDLRILASKLKNNQNIGIIVKEQSLTFRSSLGKSMSEWKSSISPMHEDIVFGHQRNVGIMVRENSV